MMRIGRDRYSIVLMGGPTQDQLGTPQGWRIDRARIHVASTGIGRQFNVGAALGADEAAVYGIHYSYPC